MSNDRLYILKAIELASASISDGGGPFGAVIVKDDKIIAEASNRVVTTNDPTAHAEILAIRQASALLHTHDLNGCTLYSSCEPCPMCLGAIYWSGIKKVVFACDRNDAEKAGFSDRLIYSEIVLQPHERIISFTREAENEGKKVFRQWDELENKIPY